MKKNKTPVIFTPDNEPYLSLPSVYELDKMIVLLLKQNRKIKVYSLINKDNFNNLQIAACQIIPQSISLILGVRELIRQGYLYAGITLVRPLVERVASLSWLCDHKDSIPIWECGWKYKERPSFSQLLKNISAGFPEDKLDKLRQQLNGTVHGDPESSVNSIECDATGEPVGYSPGKILNNTELCDDLACTVLGFLIVLLGRVSQVFPPSEMNYEV